MIPTRAGIDRMPNNCVQKLFTFFFQSIEQFELKQLRIESRICEEPEKWKYVMTHANHKKTSNARSRIEFLLQDNDLEFN